MDVQVHRITEINWTRSADHITGINNGWGAGHNTGIGGMYVGCQGLAKEWLGVSGIPRVLVRGLSPKQESIGEIQKELVRHGGWGLRKLLEACVEVAGFPEKKKERWVLTKYPRSVIRSCRVPRRVRISFVTEPMEQGVSAGYARRVNQEQWCRCH